MTGYVCRRQVHCMELHGMDQMSVEMKLEEDKKSEDIKTACLDFKDTALLPPTLEFKRSIFLHYQISTFVICYINFLL